LSLQIATNAGVLTEPLLFYLSFSQRPDAKHQLREHKISLREVTRIEFVSPHASNRSEALEAVSRAGLVRIRIGETYLMELGFDGEMHGRVADFRPTLPLLFRW